jgi:membrane protease YdiL (CAAX protease family)
MDQGEFMATFVPVPESSAPQDRSIAPVWHTLLLVLIMLGISALGSNQERHTLSHSARVGMYLLTMGVEWLTVAFAIWGIRKQNRITVRELIGGKWERPEDVLLDMAIAAGFLIVSFLVLGGLAIALGLNKHPADLQKLSFLAPRGALEIVLWILVSSTAGFCEEVMYRGYLQRQLTAWTNLVWVAIIGQGLIFGGSHAYEGGKRMLLIAVFGMMFGVLAFIRKSLRPGMMTHAAYDIIAGLALSVFTK